MVKDDEIVNVPVPRRYLQAVYRLLAEPLNETASQTQTVRGWTREEFIRLKREVRNESQIAMLDMTAAQPDTWISFSALMARTGRSHPELRGDLSGFTQLCKHYKPTETNTWPVFWKEMDGEIHYRMSPVMAHWWREA